MIYLDNGATSLHKPACVYRAVEQALRECGNPGRGGHRAAMAAAERIYGCREGAARLFHCQPEQVVLTGNCTHGLNIAIRSLVKPGDRVVVSGFEHNAVIRPLHALRANIQIAGRKLFDREDTLRAFSEELDRGAKAAVFTHVSNVFGYILPVGEMSALCKARGVPFIIDAAQSAGVLPVDMEALGAEFIAMPGHKGLLGPMGTGILLCAREGAPLLYGGTGSASFSREMPQELPERQEAGTLNVPGFAGLEAALAFLGRFGTERIFAREHRQLRRCVAGLKSLGFTVFSGDDQSGTVSFLTEADCEETAEILGNQGIAVRAGFHCAPVAHESAGTEKSGTVRVSFGYDAGDRETEGFLRAVSKFPPVPQ